MMKIIKMINKKILNQKKKNKLLISKKEGKIIIKSVANKNKVNN